MYTQVNINAYTPSSKCLTTRRGGGAVIRLGEGKGDQRQMGTHNLGVVIMHPKTYWIQDSTLVMFIKYGHYVFKNNNSNTNCINLLYMPNVLFRLIPCLERGCRPTPVELLVGVCLLYVVEYQELGVGSWLVPAGRGQPWDQLSIMPCAWVDCRIPPR